MFQYRASVFGRRCQTQEEVQNVWTGLLVE